MTIRSPGWPALTRWSCSTCHCGCAGGGRSAAAAGGATSGLGCFGGGDRAARSSWQRSQPTRPMLTSWCFGGVGPWIAGGLPPSDPALGDTSHDLACNADVMPYALLFTDEGGMSRFEDVEVRLDPVDPAPDQLGLSGPIPATAVLCGRAPADGSHPEQPESRRQLMICLSGSGEITATGETRQFVPGDVLLVEDVDGRGHASRTIEGFTVAVVVL